MLSTVLSYLLVALAALGVIAVFVLIRTLGKLGDTAEAFTGIVGTLDATAKSATATSDEARAAITEIREQLAPTFVKVDVAVDAVNANLLRLDTIMGDIEATTGQVASASHAVSNLANAPVDVVANLAGRFRKAWRVRKAEVTEDVARYTDHLSHAAQQAGHMEYAPSGAAAPAPVETPAYVAPAAVDYYAPEPVAEYVSPAEPAAEYIPAAEPVVEYVEIIEVAEIVEPEPVAGDTPPVEPEPEPAAEYVPTFEPADEYVPSFESAPGTDVVETLFEEPAEPDVDDSDADFSSEDISRFSAAAVLVGGGASNGGNGREHAGATMSAHLNCADDIVEVTPRDYRAATGDPTTGNDAGDEGVRP